MIWRAGIAAIALVLALAGSGWTQTTTVQEERGTVARIDSQTNTIVLEDGRMFRITPGTTILVDNRPAPATALRPGMPVVIRTGDPGSAGTTLVTVPASRQVVYGRVTDVDDDGEVTIRTDEGELEVRFSPDAARTIREGDTVQVQVTIMPRGSVPAASPATR